jgi:hypothetical protein
VVKQLPICLLVVVTSFGCAGGPARSFPGLEASLVREAVVEATADQVWARVLVYAATQAARIDLAHKDIGLVSFSFLSVPQDAHLVPLLNPPRSKNDPEFSLRPVGYEAEVYVTVLLTRLDQQRTGVTARSVVRVRYRRDGKFFDLGLPWSKVESEIVHAAKTP